MMHSFKELAATVGVKLGKKELKQHGTSVVIADKCGWKAERIWNLLNYRESCRLYGDNGKHILTAEEIAEATGFSEGTVVACCVNLIKNGYLRSADGGNAVKAA